MFEPLIFPKLTYIAIVDLFEDPLCSDCVAVFKNYAAAQAFYGGLCKGLF